MTIDYSCIFYESYKYDLYDLQFLRARPFFTQGTAMSPNRALDTNQGSVAWRSLAEGLKNTWSFSGWL